MSALTTKWNLPLEIWQQTALKKNKIYKCPHSKDDPLQCEHGEDYWYNYRNDEYTYSYNSWGVRDQQFKPLYGKNVIICVGDSFTTNVGAPVNESWPALLQAKYNIPVIQLSLSKLQFQNIQVLVDKAKEFFIVNDIFILSSIYNEEYRATNQTNLISTLVPTDIEQNINVMKEYAWVQGAHYQFDPPWSFLKSELPVLYEKIPDAHAYLKFPLDLRELNFNAVVNCIKFKNIYNEIGGNNWIPWQEFCKNLLLIQYNTIQLFPKVDHARIRVYINSVIASSIYRSRDGWHFSKYTNQLLADYFYNQANINHL